MENKIYYMKFNKVYPLLIAKAQRKTRTKAEVNYLTNWLLGYSELQIEEMLNSDLTYQNFIEKAPCLNEKYLLIKGSICGVKIEAIDEKTMRIIRCLDKLVDELAKGKTMEKILKY